uniref:CRAL-TRIO domain-containing protein n=1 Tax=Globodera pallida TaxID=36090 RepID=A0A183C2J3_GLOPA
MSATKYPRGPTNFQRRPRTAQAAVDDRPPHRLTFRIKNPSQNETEIVPKLKNHLLLRRLFHLDSIADGPRDHQVHKHWEAGLTSESGLIPDCLVNIEQSGTNDYWGMLHTFPINHVLRARIYDLEVMLRGVMAKEEATGRQHSVLYVMDLSGLKYDRNLITLLAIL